MRRDAIRVKSNAPRLYSCVLAGIDFIIDIVYYKILKKTPGDGLAFNGKE